MNINVGKEDNLNEGLNSDDNDKYNLPDLQECFNDIDNKGILDEYFLMDVETIKVITIFINKDDLIDNIKSETIVLSMPNILSWFELNKLIKNCDFKNVSKKYKLLSLMKYNLNISHSEMNDIIRYNKCPQNLNAFQTYLTNAYPLEDIKYERTINLFQDLNSCIIIFYEKKNNNKITKRVTFNTPIDNSLRKNKNKNMIRFNKTKKKI